MAAGAASALSGSASYFTCFRISLNTLFPDPVSCYCDLKPQNIVFDGERVWPVDWQAAFANNRCFDLALASNFAVTNDAEEAIVCEFLLLVLLRRSRRQRFRRNCTFSGPCRLRAGPAGEALAHEMERVAVAATVCGAATLGALPVTVITFLIIPLVGLGVYRGRRSLPSFRETTVPSNPAVSTGITTAHQISLQLGTALSTTTKKATCTIAIRSGPPRTHHLASSVCDLAPASQRL